MSSKYGFSLSMLGWALNEDENIADYIQRAGDLLESLTDDYELVLIDDGSTDLTWQIAHDCAMTRPWLRVYRNQGNRGPGYNTKRAISLATKDYVFWQTVDWAYDLSMLTNCLGLLNQFDVLQGVREHTLSPSGILRRRSDTARKGFVSAINYALIRFLFRLPLHDYQNVTVYPRELIQSCVLETESSFTNPECLLKAWWRGAAIKEVPVRFLKRERGIAKGTHPRQIISAMRDIFYWWIQWIVLQRRIHFDRGTVTYWSEGVAPERPLSLPTGLAADGSPASTHDEAAPRRAA